MQKFTFKAEEVSTVCLWGQEKDGRVRKDRQNMCPMMVCGPFELQFRKAAATCKFNLQALICL